MSQQRLAPCASVGTETPTLATNQFEWQQENPCYASWEAFPFSRNCQTGMTPYQYQTGMVPSRRPYGVIIGEVDPHHPHLSTSRPATH